MSKLKLKLSKAHCTLLVTICYLHMQLLYCAFSCYYNNRYIKTKTNFTKTREASITITHMMLVAANRSQFRFGQQWLMSPIK
uniref:Uncharacterized protein n=1 Tax=Medicago truncatula TaxID=3880 RepID=I3SM90_MEDTR|nr:unknown [Medicago truncatula]